MTKLSCPKDPSHKRFSATAHEVRDWVVDQDGGWISSGACSDSIGPDFDNSECMECGAETTVDA